MSLMMSTVILLDKEVKYFWVGNSGSLNNRADTYLREGPYQQSAGYTLWYAQMRNSYFKLVFT